MSTPADPNPTADLPPDASPPSVQQSPSGEQPGDRIGPYKLLQPLGEGGMGTVWVAEQEQPVKRRVALKLIKPGMDSALVLRRFEAERQALALMDHPNIAKVLDAGTTSAGRPYFAMDLVKGVPITKYCDELHLSIAERLQLFVSVCQAVQHAHQKGIIHRDIKPSNVLIAVHDGKPVPKIIDFGVAKALNQRLTEESMYTEIGAVIGTLEYMSPEQAELSPLDIDTRADIYSLGVLLYQLLTGTTPINAKRLRQAGYVEAVRIVTQEEPTKPSTRLSESKEQLATLAAERRTDPKKLMKTVRGELDWIVMKCLEKDRTRRYETANGLGRDIERHLADEPVEAGPPSKAYRLRKFVARNKSGVLATAVILLALVGGVTGIALGAVRAERARQSESRRAESERFAKEELIDQAAQFEATLRRLIAEYPSDSQLQFQLAVLHGSHGRLEEAIAEHEKILKMEPTYGPSLNALAWILTTGPPSIRDLRRSKDLAQRAVLLYPSRPAFRNTLGVILCRSELYDSAGRVIRENLASENSSRGIDLYVLSICLSKLGDTEGARAKFSEAERWTGRVNLTKRERDELKQFQQEADAVLTERK